MLDPALIRDQFDDIRARLETRGAGTREAVERLAALDKERRAAAADARKPETGPESGWRADREGEARRRGRLGAARGEQGAGGGDQAARRLAGDDRSGAPSAAAAPAQRAARQRAGRQERRGQSGRAAARPAAGVRLRAEAALGAWRRARHPGLRTRRPHVRRALRRADGRRRASRPRAHRLHARSPHARARLHRSRAAVPGEHRGADRHRQPAEVRAGSVQDRRRLGPVPDPDRGSPAHQSSPRGNPRRARRCRSDTRPTRRVSAAKRVRMAPTCAG